ncbi:MAG: hypothetical protein JWL59_3102 [Chthoniobacteraceae bacterium]|nr:hypothetical protein [Chthoniobacteraceae bacterium]
MTTRTTTGLTAFPNTAQCAATRLAHRASVTLAATFALVAIPTPGHSVTEKNATSVMTTAEAQIGKRYYWGHEGPTDFDCSGFTKFCYAQARITIPKFSGDQYLACNMSVSTKTKAALLFFATDSTKPGALTHVTLSSGDGVYSVGANGSPIFDKSGKLIGNTGSVEKFKFAQAKWAKLLSCAISTKW